MSVSLTPKHVAQDVSRDAGIEEKWTHPRKVIAANKFVDASGVRLGIEDVAKSLHGNFSKRLPSALCYIRRVSSRPAVFSRLKRIPYCRVSKGCEHPPSRVKISSL